MPPANDFDQAISALPPGAEAYIQYIESFTRASVAEPIVEVAYGPAPGQQLEVFAPAGARNLPVLVFFHGGAWIRGGLPWLRFMVSAVVAQPAVFVAGTYRLAPGSRWPEPYRDVCAALRHVLEHAAGWGGDSGRVVAGGHSAGGHLAALAVLKGEVLGMQGCVPVSAPCDIRYGDVDIESEAGRVYKYLLEHRSQDAEASPVLFTAGNSVPFHLMWGTNDFPRIAQSNPAMLDALQRSGSPVTHQVLDGANHFETHMALADPSHPWYAKVRSMWQGAAARR